MTVIIVTGLQTYLAYCGTLTSDFPYFIFQNYHDYIFIQNQNVERSLGRISNKNTLQLYTKT